MRIKTFEIFGFDHPTPKMKDLMPKMSAARDQAPNKNIMAFKMILDKLDDMRQELILKGVRVDGIDEQISAIIENVPDLEDYFVKDLPDDIKNPPEFKKLRKKDIKRYNKNKD